MEFLSVHKIAGTPRGRETLMKSTSLGAAWAALLLALPLHAAVAADSPLLRGWYVAPMYAYVNPDNNRLLDAGHGGALAFGYRVSEGFAIELYGVYGRLDREPDPSASATISGGGIGALAFLAGWLDGLYLPFAIGYLQADRQGLGGERYDGLSFETGLGYLFPLSVGRYDFAIRAEGRYRHHNGQDGRLLDEKRSGQQDVLANLGLQLPLGLRPPEPEAEPEPVHIVEAIAVPDSDGDGVPDDRDQCPGTPAGATVDASGCPLPPPPPPCGLAGSDEHRSLQGCAAGEVIVLRGVHFPSDQSELTDAATAILDQVVAELRAHPQIRVEIGGHTDSQGAAAYNLRLSTQRADAVRSHLIAGGVQPERLTVRGYGEDQPLADNETDAGRERNRRVELRVIDPAAE
jgi:OmpA-OmpF porin, OOP family